MSTCERKVMPILNNADGSLHFKKISVSILNRVTEREVYKRKLPPGSVGSSCICFPHHYLLITLWMAPLSTLGLCASGFLNLIWLMPPFRDVNRLQRKIQYFHPSPTRAAHISCFLPYNCITCWDVIHG